jgi:hypothetical protein
VRQGSRRESVCFDVVSIDEHSRGSGIQECFYRLDFSRVRGLKFNFKSQRTRRSSVSSRTLTMKGDGRQCSQFGREVCGTEWLLEFCTTFVSTGSSISSDMLSTDKIEKRFRLDNGAYGDALGDR